MSVDKLFFWVTNAKFNTLWILISRPQTPPILNSYERGSVI